MDEPLEIRPPEPLPVFSFPPPEPDRARLRRRLLALLAVGLMAFTLATWTLVRVVSPFEWLAGGSGAARVVRAQLEALSRGELRAAYDLFSPRYREQVPFEVFHELVVSHRRMFRIRELEFSEREQTHSRAVLEAQLVAADGERYRARYTLVRDNGRWWVDDLRWGAARGRRTFSVI